MKKPVVTQTSDIDDRPSPFPMQIIDQGKLMAFRLDVLGEGTIEMIVDATVMGRLVYKGMRLIGAK